MPVDEKSRKRMVVEEVSDASPVISEPVVAPQSAPLEEVKEKVEELRDITEDLSQSVEKSEDVQEEIVKAVEGAAPVSQVEEVISESKEEDSSPMPTFEPLPQAGTPSGTNPLVIIIPGIFLLGALLGGIYFYQKGIVGMTPSPSPTPEVMTVVTPAPSSTPSATVNLSSYPINIMNGSGTPGQAGAVKTILVAAGFTVSVTGNAASYDFTKTVIKAKTDVPATVISKLSAALSKSYILDTNQTLATSSADEIQVIVGSTKAQ